MATRPDSVTRWLAHLGLDIHRLRGALGALPPAEVAALCDAARSPHLGELALTVPRPVSAALAAAGCVFTLPLHTGPTPREHAWLTHLGWALALYVQPGGGGLTMPAAAVNLARHAGEHLKAQLAKARRHDLFTLGALLCLVDRRARLLREGRDPEYRMLTRLSLSALCAEADRRQPGTPPAPGGAVADRVRRVVAALPEADALSLAALAAHTGTHPEATGGRHAR